MDGLLKFITCGSVDDGKSTLIGHILYDAKLLYADQEEVLLLDSKVGSREGEIDYSLLLDGLMAEREQGITIDVAYRYFTTKQRSFIVADTPGHEEYTRNMAVGASFAQLAIILVDAKQGVLLQTRRHCRICAFMGIRYFVFAVNKMDLVDYSEERFQTIKEELLNLAEELELKNISIIPVSAIAGDNVTRRSERTPWYRGDTLLHYLETVDVSVTDTGVGFYMPVQRVCRPNHEFRGFQGQVESGTVKMGQKLIILPGNETAMVKNILVGNQAMDAVKGQAVTIQLDREVDVSRGCVLSDTGDLPVQKNIKATLLWMDDELLTHGREYLVKLGTKRIPAVVKNIICKIDVNSGASFPTDKAEKNEIISCEIEFSEKIVVDTFKRNQTLGELILIDRVSHMTSACGVVEQVEADQPYFEKGPIKAGGYIFEEFYFNLENPLLSGQRAKKTTYHVADTIAIEGNSFQYPEYFDIISLEDAAAILIRNRKIWDIIKLEGYEYSGLPLLDERGFALKIRTQADFYRLVAEFKALNMEEGHSPMEEKHSPMKRAAFHNKWSRFETYRRIVCNDNFWMI